MIDYEPPAGGFISHTNRFKQEDVDIRERAQKFHVQLGGLTLILHPSELEHLAGVINRTLDAHKEKNRADN